MRSRWEDVPEPPTTGPLGAYWAKNFRPPGLVRLDGGGRSLQRTRLRFPGYQGKIQGFFGFLSPYCSNPYVFPLIINGLEGFSHFSLKS